MRRATTGLGTPGAPKAARYYGTTAQKSVGPNRPIVLRISADARRITRALFGESVKCSDGKLSVGVEAPRTNAPIDSRGRVKDRDRFTITAGEIVTYVDDRFTAAARVARRARDVLALGPHDRPRERTHDPDVQVGHGPLARLALSGSSVGRPSRSISSARAARRVRVSGRLASADPVRVLAAVADRERVERGPRGADRGERRGELVGQCTSCCSNALAMTSAPARIVVHEQDELRDHPRVAQRTPTSSRAPARSR